MADENMNWNQGGSVDSNLSSQLPVIPSYAPQTQTSASQVNDPQTQTAYAPQPQVGSSAQVPDSTSAQPSTTAQYQLPYGASIVPPKAAPTAQSNPATVAQNVSSPYVASSLTPDSVQQQTSSYAPPSLPAYKPTSESDLSSKKSKRNKDTSEEKSGKHKGVKRVFIIALAAILFGCFTGITSMGLYAYIIEPRMRAEAVSAANKAIKHGGDSSSGGYSKKKSSTSVKEGERDSVTVDVDKIDTSATYTPAEIYAANVNSTVGINTSLTVNYYGYETTAAASGSGFIITEDGYIVTNHHVIENANDIKVTTYDGAIYDAELIGYDKSDDLAVLKIDEEGLTPVILGDSSIMNVGDSVMAIGNPLGELTFSLTTGVVSALKRSITINDSRMYLLQTDCAINSGNSGGPLFNAHGEVIGITSAKYSQSNLSEASIENIGFAIPISSVKDIIFSMIENGTYTKPYIGVKVEDAISSNRYDLTYGIGIRDVDHNGPADQIQLKPGDVITEIDGTSVNSTDELHDYIMEAGIGGTLTMTIYRDGKTFTVEITISEQEYDALEN